MATVTSVGSGLWSATGTWDTGVPVDGDTVVIAAGHNVQVDVDQSAWTGLLGMTVNGGTTPGMVYWKDGTSGTLKFRTGANIAGTSDTNNGRILANSDGLWSTTTALVSNTDAIIMLNGTAKMDCSSLDVRMRCANPTYKRARTYGTKYDFDGATDVDPANDTIDLNTIPPSVGTLVMVTTASGTLPEGLLEDTQYYVRAVSGTTCKLAYQNNDSSIIDITADGSGTCTLYTGYSSGSTVVNVLDDVTEDIWAVGDHVVLANVGPQNYDQQRLSLNAINAGTIELSASVNSNQKPGSSIWLMERNCRILHSSTYSAQRIIDGGNDCIFGEIRATTGTGTTFYCYGLYSGTGHTIETISGCTYGLYIGTGHTAETISGCNYGIQEGTGHTIGTVSGCNYGINSGTEHTTETISGCTYGLYSGTGHTIGTISGCNYGLRSGTGHTAETISGCSYGVYTGIGHTTETISGCSYGVREIGGLFHSLSSLIGNTNDLSRTGKIYVRNGKVSSAPVLYYLNSKGYKEVLFSEHHQGVLDAHRIFQCFGNATKVTAGSGDPIPDQRSGGNATLVELSNLQSNMDSNNGIFAWDTDAVRVWVDTSTKTYRFYIQSTFALTASEFKLTAEYMNSASNTGTTTVDSDESIAVRTGITDWSQYVEVTVTPARTGWVRFDINLYKYSAGGQVFIDPLMEIS